MRTFQFWILVILSSIVSLLMIKQIFLTRSLKQEQAVYMEVQQLAATAPNYENAWKQLAMRVYQVSSSDPELSEVLKEANVQVRPAPPGGASGSAAGAPNASPAP